MNALLNAVGYQVVWLFAVDGAARGVAWPAWAAMAAFALLQVKPREWRLDLSLMLVIVLLGTTMDTLWAATGLVSYATPVPLAQAAPAWIVGIWCAFSLTLRRSFRFLHGRPWLAALVGGAGAPLAYVAAAQGWQAVAFPHGMTLAVAVMAAGWALAFPLMFAITRRLERQRTTAPLAEGHAHG